ncbi:hypothetical protein DV515_00016547 [Chloebia gouldiae]|uniref:Uncharacterized protein n=1 Tax=Chloebia gouldiae TaxID=44316 RepID=A0A3L8RTK6_CHLGU|nr:hypothetical protein DV515_00016547 [Chloebia gouldiae]
MQSSLPGLWKDRDYLQGIPFLPQSCVLSGKNGTEATCEISVTPSSVSVCRSIHLAPGAQLVLGSGIPGPASCWQLDFVSPKG